MHCGPIRLVSPQPLQASQTNRLAETWTARAEPDDPGQPLPAWDQGNLQIGARRMCGTAQARPKRQNLSKPRLSFPATGVVRLTVLV